MAANTHEVPFAQNVPLAPYTTFQIGGPAEYFVSVTTEAELYSALTCASAQDLPVTVLGGGSNVLVADAGVRGCVIHVAIAGRSQRTKGTTIYYTCGAGEVFDEVVAATTAAGWWGLENLSHIPGSVGATPVQNVGAYGVEVSDCIVSVEAMNIATGKSRTFTNAECGFGYRSSFFKSAAGSEWVITHVTFALSTQPDPALSYADLQTRLTDIETLTSQRVREEIILIRSAKFPDWHTIGTAGSFFKNPVVSKAKHAELVAAFPEVPSYVQGDQYKVALGWILDRVCAARGYAHERVATYTGQALVVINTGGATAQDVCVFADDLAQQVQTRTNIAIEWEVTKLGDHPAD